MLVVHVTCCLCDGDGPVEAIATRRDGHRFALCPARAARPGGLRALVARLHLRPVARPRRRRLVPLAR